VTFEQAVNVITYFHPYHRIDKLGFSLAINNPWYGYVKPINRRLPKLSTYSFKIPPVYKFYAKIVLLWDAFLCTQGRHMGEIDVYIHSFLILALNAGEWSTSWLGHFTLEEITLVPTE
jgi:hypothetical protein